MWPSAVKLVKSKKLIQEARLLFGEKVCSISKFQGQVPLLKNVKAALLGQGNHLRSRFTFYFLLLTLFLFTSACTSTQPVIKIGLVAPFEGEHRAIGYDAIYSARLAVREVNNRGGLGGYKVALVALDDSADPRLARETAAALAIDPDVIAVVGHWRPETSTVARPVYENNHLPFILLGDEPFVPVEPSQLPADFKNAYAAVTPFEEVADVYAGSTYDAFQLLFAAVEQTAAAEGHLTRESLTNSLHNLRIDGITGIVYLKNGN